MAYTNIPDSNTGDKVTAEHLNALRDNPVAIAEGQENAPKIKLNSLPFLNVVGRQFFSNQNEEELFFDAGVGLTINQVPKYAFVYGIEYDPLEQDVRAEFPATGRIIPVRYIDNGQERTGGWRISLYHATNRRGGNYSIDTYIWYQTRTT